ncbi:hypothetical protein [Sphingosinicella terrae]|uniref:hypothetical protein n=1 Tax=Sphingosinicella terrae TaxID=2172047 RepID=UPI000E0CEBBE|nr:hypothetical protein [Sphingosinicella terrae]
MTLAGLWMSGCTTPHHSNALIFGTNTSFGIDVGQSPTGTPTILVGYRRQEAVFMPLVANVLYDQNGTPTPCYIQPRIVAGVPQPPPAGTIPACYLVGQNGGAIDSYSVLASFGAQFEADAVGGTAGGGLAQFFATGLAAQALAIEGGPALVAVGNAAALTGATPNATGIAALYNAPEVTTIATGVAQQALTARDSLIAFIRSHTTADDFSQRMGAIEQAAAAPVGTLTIGVCRGQGRELCLAHLATDAGRATVGLFNYPWPAAVNQVVSGGN